MTMQASAFIKAHNFGVLSTHSLSHPGYPFGSIVPYLISPQGRIAIFISHLAEHSKNIAVDNKVALTISEINHVDSPGSSARITCLAEALLSDQQQTLRDSYQQQFKDAEMVLSLPGFQFYELALTAIRLIGGFGEIQWLAPDQLDLREST